MSQEQQEQRMGSAKKWAKSAGGELKLPYKLPQNVSLFKPKEGKKRLDIIPFVAGLGNPRAEEGELYFERTYWSHRDVGPGSVPVLCQKKTFGKKCFICEHRAKLERDPDVEKKTIEDLLPKERQIFLVFDQADPEKGIQLWDVSFHLFGKKLRDEILDADDDQGFDTFFAPRGGKTLRVGFAEKKQGGFTFIETRTIGFIDRERLDKELRSQAICLDKLLKPSDYDEVKALFMQEDPDEDEDDDRPKKKRPPDDDDDDDDDTPPKKKKPVEEDDDEPPKKKKKPVEEEEDDEPPKKRGGKTPPSDDDDDEPAPKKKRPPVDDDDDDEDEPKPKSKKKDPDWEDDDDEPAPKKKKKPVDDDDDDDE